MPHTGAQHELQAGLASGFSATEGYHDAEPNYVDPSFDGSKFILPQDTVPDLKTSRYTLKGKNGNVEVPWMSVGAWPWGDKATWHYEESERGAISDTWKHLYDQGMFYIDTAQVYGDGDSEVICGELVKGLPRDSFVMQTKYYVVPDNATNFITPSNAPIKFLRDSLKRMNLDYLDVYMVHGPIHPGSIKQVAKGMAECVEAGLAKVVAVANYSKEELIEMHDALAEHGIPLALIQCEYHILRRIDETQGLFQACRDRGIVFQSYSSLAQSRLTGKWSKDNQPPSTYRFSSYPMEKLEPTLSVLEKIAKKRNVPVCAVALNYAMGKGVLPVVGMRKLQQAEDNLKAFGWRLTSEEYKELDAVSVEGKTSKLWQHG